jgi:hypothetical protein
MMIQRNEFGATKALQVFESSSMSEHKERTHSPMIKSITTTNTSSMKRSRSSASSSFDMGDFIKASQQVEETIAFPTIEWPSLDCDDSDDSSSSDDSDFSFSRTTKDDDDDSEDDDFFQQQPSRKRQCRGLTRCDRSCNLSSLFEMAITSERRGSNGSLS